MKEQQKQKKKNKFIKINVIFYNYILKIMNIQNNKIIIIDNKLIYLNKKL